MQLTQFPGRMPEKLSACQRFSVWEGKATALLFLLPREVRNGSAGHETAAIKAEEKREIMLFRKQSVSAGQGGRYVIRRTTWIGTVLLVFGVFSVAGVAVTTGHVYASPLVDPIVGADGMNGPEVLTDTEGIVDSEPLPTPEPSSEAFTPVEIFYATACYGTGSPRADSRYGPRYTSEAGSGHTIVTIRNAHRLGMIEAPPAQHGSTGRSAAMTRP